MNKDLQYYMKLPYQVIITPPEYEEDDWYASIPELKSCTTQAATWGELEQQIKDAKESWLTVALELGIKIPEPKKEPA